MIDRMAVLEEIIELSQPPTIGSDEFTINDYLVCFEERTGLKLNRRTVNGRLDRLVDEGKLKKRLVFDEGRWCIAYSRIEERTK